MPLEVWLPLLNTSLIVISGVCLLIGVWFIKRKNVPAHKASMLTASSFAGLFLIVYVTRYFVLEETIFPHEGLLKIVYLSILIVHIIFAIGLLPLVIITLRRALTENFEKHKRIAKITFPVWLFVALSGWVIYWMLHYL
jgi:putative membrane protein